MHLAATVKVDWQESGREVAMDGIEVGPDGTGVPAATEAPGIQAGFLSSKEKWSGSVGRILSAVAGATVIPLGRRLPDGSSHLPARSSGPSARRHRSDAASRAYLMLLRMGFGLPSLSPAMR